MAVTFLAVLKASSNSADECAEKSSNKLYFSLNSFKNGEFQPLDLVTIAKSDGVPVLYGIAWPSLSVTEGTVEINYLWAINGLIHANDSVTVEKYKRSLQEPLPSLSYDMDGSLSDIIIRQEILTYKYIFNGMVITVADGMSSAKVKISIDTDQVSLDQLMANSLSFSDLSISLIDETTKIQRIEICASEESSVLDANLMDSVGGLDEQLALVKEAIELPMTNPELYAKYNIVPPKGILLYGPPGTGKTLLVKAVARQLNVHFLVINGPEIIGQYYGETEETLRNLFNKAKTNAPSIVFIDEIDSICPKRDESQSDVDKRLVATFLTLLDGIESKDSRHPVFVIGATNRPNAIDSALRRPGRFDKEIEIGIPNAGQRSDILSKLLQKIPNTLTDKDICNLMERAHGFVGADIALLVREASMNCLTSRKDIMDLNDMQSVMTRIKPSAMREIMIEVPKVHWNDIGGQAFTKQQLKESVEWPLKYPEAFLRMGITPPKGVLLYGPPGCSKTLMAKALATEAKLNFIAVKGPELFNKWVGESERAIREVFRKARSASPSIVFFDEIDAIAGKRGTDQSSSSLSDRVLSTLLNEMDGVEQLLNVTVIAATNRPDCLDEALLRPGRFDRLIYISPPDFEARKEILKIQSKKMPFAESLDLDAIAKLTDGYTGAELVNICQEAALCALEQNINIAEINSDHFAVALSHLKPRLSSESLALYESYRQN